MRPEHANTAEISFYTPRVFRSLLLDRDLGGLYGVSTGALNQAVKRNSQRFPDEFVFQLTKEEADLRSQFVILNESNGGSKRGKHLKYLPFPFTEHGALMAANVLRSRRAVQMSVLKFLYGAPGPKKATPGSRCVSTSRRVR